MSSMSSISLDSTPRPTPDSACFALLDDCGSTGQRRTSRLYENWSHQHDCIDPAKLDAMLKRVEGDLAAGLHAVVLADYEWGVRLQGQAVSHASYCPRDSQSITSEVPAPGSALADSARSDIGSCGALRVLMFRRRRMLSCAEVTAWLAERDATGSIDVPSAAGIADLQASISREVFDADLRRIRRALENGDSYQVNYTYRLGFGAFGAPVALYRRLRAAQSVPYGALIALPEDKWVLSCSPELFVEHQAGQLRTRPMKGTAARSGDPACEADEASGLRESSKDRAENVMIVDLLRNDLARVAVTGSVHVPALFSVEPHGQVWQMTSSVSARLQPQLSFADVLRALFPCGSITGAPKHRTMELIGEVETYARGLYTGAIGWLDGPPRGIGPADASGADLPDVGRACGDFCLSVAIRTIVLDQSDANGCRSGAMGVGAGIVMDSDATQEYQECALKARFLTTLDPGFELFETMWAHRESGIRHLERHLNRLEKSALQLGFLWNRTATKNLLAEHLQNLIDGSKGVAFAGSMPFSSAAAPWESTLTHPLVASVPDKVNASCFRLRLVVQHSGKISVTSAPLLELGCQEPVKLLLADDVSSLGATRSNDYLLRHKTTARAQYNRAWHHAEMQGAFDTIFCNERNEITEGGRSNIFVKLDGRWVTPPLASGILEGIMRGVLLEDRAFDASIAVVHRADLGRADELMVCNALRGGMRAVLAKA